jgi:hypothetical protein
METGTAIKHYSAKLELPTNHTLIEILGDDAAEVRETVQAIMKGGCRFEPFGATTLVYHPTIDAGKRAIGWLTQFELPAHLSNKAWVERRDPVAA